MNSPATSLIKEIALAFRFHIKQVIDGGWPVLSRKLRKFLVMLIFLPYTLPALLIVRALRPLVLIRLYPMNSERIGNLAFFTEMYMCRHDNEVSRRPIHDIFYYDMPVANKQLKKMWDRVLHVSFLARPVDTLNRSLPRGTANIIPPNLFIGSDPEGLLPCTQAHLSFNAEEERIGTGKLKLMGVPEGMPFVCFHARDSAYLANTFPDEYMGFHDHRDSDVNNYMLAAEEMTRRGYYTIRMGAVVKEPVKTTNPMIIDYAKRYREDFMDIYLCGSCRFYLGDTAGLVTVPYIFRKPVAHVNWIPVGAMQTNNPKNLYIFKKYWLRNEQRFLTFTEIFRHDLHGLARAEQYEQAGIVPVENTPEEIIALAIEMDERLKGTWQATEEDEELQRRFWGLFKPSAKKMHGMVGSWIGADFLRRNRELLD